MPRQRMVKPEFFDSESLAMCSVGARLCFIGLWVMGDDYGNQKCQFVRLKHRIFPFDDMPDETFAGYLEELESVGCIKAYEVDGERFITTPNFTTYQTVRKPSKSSTPEPPKSVARQRRTSLIHQWRTSDAPVVDDGCSDAPVTHQYATSDPERKKEGSNFSLREKIANEREREAAAVERSTAMRSNGLCPDCSGPLRFVPGSWDTADQWWCDKCRSMKEVG